MTGFLCRAFWYLRTSKIGPFVGIRVMEIVAETAQAVIAVGCENLAAAHLAC